ncbi:MAG: hypothetical protein J6T49_05810 [Bacteroidales bacterium]|nr:hypothetical protein [Bacteroidales bacterium]MBO7479962.1 hypothetical protein [Bacteroidales bacterium]MBO7487414.1 hypothetical protein [Bacteroidales bacterium]
MSVFFVLFFMFILFSIAKSESDRRRRAAQRRTQVPPPLEEDLDFDKPDFTVPEPTTVSEPSAYSTSDTYHGEDVPRTTAQTVVKEEKKVPGKELDFDPEEMIIYSEILKPKF